MRIFIIILLATLVSCGTRESYLRVDSGAPRGSLKVGWPVLSKDGSPDLVFVNTVHIGEPQFFEAVQARLDQTPIVLMEGVHGEVFALKELQSGYQKLSRVLGLSTQHENLKRRPAWHMPDVHVSELGSALDELPMKIRMVVSEFKRRVGHEKAAIKRSRPELSDAEVDSWAKADVRRALGEILADDSDPDPVLILFRNDHLLLALDELLETKTEADGPIAICYGAGHCSDLISKLKRKGWARASLTWQPVFDVAPLVLY